MALTTNSFILQEGKECTKLASLLRAYTKKGGREEGSRKEERGKKNCLRSTSFKRKYFETQPRKTSKALRPSPDIYWGEIKPNVFT